MIPIGPRVVVPWTNQTNTRTVDLALRQQGVIPEWVYVGDGDFEYHKLLSGLWEAQEDIIIVEQDVVPWPGSIRRLWGCRRSWCSYPVYIIGRGLWDRSLSVGKFSGKLMAKYPNLVRTLPDKTWRFLDAYLATALIQQTKRQPHRHQPPVTHLHESHLRMSDKTGVLGDFPFDRVADVDEYLQTREPRPPRERSWKVQVIR